MLLQSAPSASYPGSWWLPTEGLGTRLVHQFHMRPATIVLNYSIKYIQNDVRQTIILKKSQFNSLVWGSLTLVPIM